MTHLLRMPLATRESRPQLKRSLRHVTSDPTASKITPAAFATPDMLHLNIGGLRLETPEATKQALTLLENIRHDKSLWSSSVPFRVSVSGLLHNNSLHDCRRLYAPVIDHSSTRAVAAYRRAVKHRFLDAGLMALNGRERSSTAAPMYTAILQNKRVKSKAFNTSPKLNARLPEGVRRNLLKSYDLRESYNKFRNLTWAADFALERLSIVDVHPPNIIKDGRVTGRGHEEIASIPLPGIEHLEQEPELQGVTYVRPQWVFL